MIITLKRGRQVLHVRVNAPRGKVFLTMSDIRRALADKRLGELMAQREAKTRRIAKPLKMNPIRGEWWIDDSGNAQFADGDIGDMNHEMYVIDGLTRDLAGYFDVEVDSEYAGTLDNYHDEIRDYLLENEEITEDDDVEDAIFPYLEKHALRNYNDDLDQLAAALAVANGRADGRDYALEYQGWVRVHGNNIQTWGMSREVLDRIADGIMDAQDEDLDEEEFNIEVMHPERKFYQGVPWSVIKEGDPGALRVYS